MTERTVTHLTFPDEIVTACGRIFRALPPWEVATTTIDDADCPACLAAASADFAATNRGETE